LLDKRCEPLPCRQIDRCHRDAQPVQGGVQLNGCAATTSPSATTLSRSDQPQLYRPVDRFRTKTLGHHQWATDILPVESYEDILYYDSGLPRLTIPDHPHYHQLARLAGFGLQCLRHETG
jgi:hypothetical protein